jgi:hypothetical protein
MSYFQKASMTYYSILFKVKCNLIKVEYSKTAEVAQRWSASYSVSNDGLSLPCANLKVCHQRYRHETAAYRVCHQLKLEMQKINLLVLSFRYNSVRQKDVASATINQDSCYKTQLRNIFPARL